MDTAELFEVDDIGNEPGPKRNHFQNAPRKIPAEQLRRVEKIKPFSRTQSSKNKKMQHFDHFPCPGEIDPYMN